MESGTNLSKKNSKSNAQVNFRLDLDEWMQELEKISKKKPQGYSKPEVTQVVNKEADGGPKALLMEIVTAFGSIKAYHFEANTDLDSSYAFLEYAYQSVNIKACVGMNSTHRTIFSQERNLALPLLLHMCSSQDIISQTIR